MPRDVFVHLLPHLFEPETLRGGVAVVIDILRASTTIVHALEAGAARVVPCLEVDEVLRMSATMDRSGLLLGGERSGRLIPGFDLDNSPLAYTRERVEGKTILFTTTNGTRALRRSSEAERIVIGAFSNLNAVLELLSSEERPVHLVCAGTGGRITAEDVLFAGALACGLMADEAGRLRMNDQAQVAAGFYRDASASRAGFEKALRSGLGGRNLAQLGYTADVERASLWDLFSSVPEYDAQSGEIRPGEQVPTGSRRLSPPPVG